MPLNTYDLRSNASVEQITEVTKWYKDGHRNILVSNKWHFWTKELLEGVLESFRIFFFLLSKIIIIIETDYV